MSTGTKVCPHCGGKMFAAKIIRGCIVEATEDGNFKVLKENTDKHDIEVLKCGRCKNELTNDDLITGVPCKECGKVVSPSELNQDGVCSICQAQKERSELANASREDLIRMLLDAERKVKVPVDITVASIVDTPEESQEEVIETETPEEPAKPEEDEKENKPKKKRAASRKKAGEEPTEEQAEEQTPSEPSEPSTTGNDETTAEVNAIADQQTAPFPDIPMPEAEPAMNPPEEPEQKDEQFGVSSFEMFQNDESF